MSACLPVSPTSQSIGWINVKEVIGTTGLCAIGDGVTDDTAAFQAALNLATSEPNPGGATGGGIVYLPPGTYLVKNTLSVAGPCSVLALRYVNPTGGVTVLQADVTKDLFDVAFAPGQYGAVFSGFSVSGQTAAALAPNMGWVFHLQPSANRVELLDLTLTNVSYGILVDGASDVRCERVSIIPYDAAPTQQVPIGSRFGFKAQKNGLRTICIDCSVDESMNQNRNVLSAFGIDGAYVDMGVVAGSADTSYTGYSSAASTAPFQPTYFHLLECRAANSSLGGELSGGADCIVAKSRFEAGVQLAGQGGSAIVVRSTYSSSSLSISAVSIEGMPNAGMWLTESTLSLSASTVKIAGHSGAVNTPGILFDGSATLPGALSALLVQECPAGAHLARTFGGTAAVSGFSESANSAGLVVDAGATGTYAMVGCALPDALQDASGTPTRRAADTIGINPTDSLAAPQPSAGTTITVTNAFGVSANVYLAPAVGGNQFTSVTVDGVSVGTASGFVRVPVGSTIVATYVGKPTWSWLGD
ncbi:MAG: glycosyl hydrolase family 28-related protein [Candidatus Baltobacteraceae bacterium]